MTKYDKKRPKESIEVHWSQSSRISRDSQKLKEAGGVQLSPLESIGVWVLERVTDPAWDKRPEESIGVHRSQSSRMSRYKLIPEARRACKSSVESILDHRSQSSKGSEHSKETVYFFTKEVSSSARGVHGGRWSQRSWSEFLLTQNLKNFRIFVHPLNILFCLFLYWLKLIYRYI